MSWWDGGVLKAGPADLSLIANPYLQVHVKTLPKSNQQPRRESSRPFALLVGPCSPHIIPYSLTLNHGHYTCTALGTATTIHRRPLPLTGPGPEEMAENTILPTDLVHFTNPGSWF
ncbi:hypothetical protein RRF57_012304 [Xylaria bambusicola]|uniref:Uncharacterized protein n=1 Tax=Xylaria bambusicola TaxID=326684 RepID=A0AAN7ZAK6_9PEZI